MRQSAQRLWLVTALVAGLIAAPVGSSAIDRRSEQTLPKGPARPTLDSTPPAIKLPGVPGVSLAPPRPNQLRVPGKIRLLVVAPHPDDETLGAAGLMQRVIALGGTVRVVFVTNGDGFRSAVIAENKHAAVSGRDFRAYGERRHHEALRAVEALGGKQIGSTFFGFPDDGIDDLWSDNWPESRPYRSPFTESDRPPYEESPRQGIEYSGVDLKRELRDMLRDFVPDWVAIPDPRDRHPDHCTTGGFVLDALRELREAQIAPFTHTEVLTYLVHYPEYPGNPLWQVAVNRAGIGGSSAGHESLSHTTWLRLDLTPDEVAHKRDALSRYRSQVQAMDRFLGLFVRPDEVFGHLNGSQISTLPIEYARRWRPHRAP